jgi:UrcA family protein
MKLIKTFLPLASLELSGLATASTKSVDDARSVVVKYDDLNLNTGAGIARLHKRITNAAESVCGQLETRILGLRDAYAECVADAIENGVAAVDNANLSQFHANRGRHVVLAANGK